VNANLLDDGADTEVLDIRADHLRRELGEVVKEGRTGLHGSPQKASCICFVGGYQCSGSGIDKSAIKINKSSSRPLKGAIGFRRFK
jgi:hypothetical protein